MYHWVYCETGAEWLAGHSCRLLRRSVSPASRSRWEEPRLHRRSRWWKASRSPSQWRSNRQTCVCTAQDWRGCKTQEEEGVHIRLDGIKQEEEVSRNPHSQVEELIKHRVQRLKLHLCALTLGHREEVMRTELHYDKWVAETCGRPEKWLEISTLKEQPSFDRRFFTVLPLASSAMMSAACRISTVSLCSGAS